MPRPVLVDAMVRVRTPIIVGAKTVIRVSKPLNWGEDNGKLGIK